LGLSWASATLRLAGHDQQGRGRIRHVLDEAVAHLAIGTGETAIGQKHRHLHQVLEAHPAFLQNLAEILPGLIALGLEAGRQLAIRRSSDLARQIQQLRSGRHFGGEAVLARERHGLRIVELDGHRQLPHVRRRTVSGRMG
jgi:hypothetical protein